MGANSGGDEMGHKLPGGSGQYVYSYTHWTEHVTIKRPGFKLETKILIWIGAELLGIKIADYLIGSINNTKEAIAFIVLTLYILVRIFFIIRFGLLRIRREEKELRDGIVSNKKPS